MVSACQVFAPNPCTLLFSNKTGTECIMQHCGAFVKLLLKWKRNNAFCVFSTLSRERQEFRETFTDDKMNVLTFSTLSAWNISHSKKNSETLSETYIGLRVKYPFLWTDFNKSLIFSIDFQKILNHQISWKFVHWRWLVLANEQTWWSEQSLFAMSQTRLKSLISSQTVCFICKGAGRSANSKHQNSFYTAINGVVGGSEN